MEKPFPHTMRPFPRNVTDGVVEGQWYRAKFFNTAFAFWVCRKLTRQQARASAVSYAGDPYSYEDIVSVRAIKAPTD